MVIPQEIIKHFDSPYFNLNTQVSFNAHRNLKLKPSVNENKFHPSTDALTNNQADILSGEKRKNN